jgi:ABC-type sugar transport system ATPase subunit
MRQAVAIARAVYWKARLMIMDEPTNNLGVPEQQKVLDLIRRLRDQGVPVILITHTLPDVFAVSDRLMVMHRGRKVTEKKTKDTSTEELVSYMVGALDDGRAAPAPAAPAVP